MIQYNKTPALQAIIHLFGEEEAQMLLKSLQSILILHFTPSMHFTLSVQSAFYSQSAFYPWPTVCILH